MTTKPMFTPSQTDPDAFDVTAPGCIILVARYAYDPESPNHGLVGALRRILSAAAAGGFKSSDLLETLLARGEVSERVRQLATKAADAAGHANVIGILRVAKGASHD